MRTEYILGIDYGEKRVGLALAHEIARLPRPLTVLPMTEQLLSDLVEIIKREGVHTVVVGLPRNMDGSLGHQAEKVQLFADTLAGEIDQPVVLVDETLSSVEAGSEDSAGSPANIDAQAAAVILERYFAEQSNMEKNTPHDLPAQ